MCADNERGRCPCAGSIPAPLAIAAAAAAARHLGAGGVPEESLSQPSIARVVSAEAFKDNNYARVKSQLGVVLPMRSLLTAATGHETVLTALGSAGCDKAVEGRTALDEAGRGQGGRETVLTALVAGQYAKPRSKDKEAVVAAWTPY